MGRNVMKLIISLLLCSLLIGCAIHDPAGNGTQTDDVEAQKAVSIPQPTTNIQKMTHRTQQAQNARPYGQAFQASKNIICNDSTVIFDLLTGEPGPQEPIFFGLIKTPEGGVKKIAQIFLNNKDFKFSIVESSTEGISCIISAGFDFDIVSRKRKQN